MFNQLLQQKNSSWQIKIFKKILKTCVLIYNGLIIKQERISSPEGTEILSSVVLVKKN